MTNLNLKKFDMSRIGKGSIVAMIGRRGGGKSYLVKDLLYYKRDVPIGTVISASESSNQFYGDMMPSLFIHEQYSPEIIANLVKRQKLVTKKMKQQQAMYGKSNIDPYAFLVLDDLMYDAPTWSKDINIKEIFMNGRHFNLMFLVTMQFSLGLLPAMRTQFDFVFMCKETFISNRKRLHDHYAGMFPTFEIFSQVMNQCTENYECLVIDNTSKSSDISSMIYWYKADSHPPFKLGAPEFWQHHSNNYCEDEEGEEDVIDITKIQKKNTLAINVRKAF
uniref:Uncharacterized protein n=1 Tax=viral metagenome TaxID=1070528 RepID=A0A6C0HL64_9ZZZZ